MTLLTTKELSSATGYCIQYIQQLVQRGLLTPAGRKGNGWVFKPDALAPKSKTHHNELHVKRVYEGEHCGTCAFFGHRSAGDACYEFNEWVSGDYPACGRWIPDAWRLRRVG